MEQVKGKSLPALRFPEFTEPWKTDSVDSFVKRINSPVAVEPDCMYRQIGVRSHGKGIFHKEPVTGKSLGEKRVFWVHSPAFVVNIVFGWEQAVALTSAAEEGYIASHRFPMFIPIKDKSDLNFLLLFFLRKRGKYLLELASPGGAGRNKTLGQSEFAQLEVTLPALPEQQKIASFIAVVDQKIKTLGRQRELLQVYKRGMMQKIFSRELRFKADDGGEFPEWEEVRLGELAQMITTKNTDMIVSRVLTNSATRGVVDQLDYFDKDIANADNIGGYYVVAEGDFVYNPRISVSAPVGPINKNKIGKGVMSPLYTVFRFKTDRNQFFEFFFASKSWHRYICSAANYGARHDRMNITNQDFRNMPMPVPHSAEQQKIADFLSAIDAKIDAVAAQIEKMAQFKKDLLQQMFV